MVIVNCPHNPTGYLMTAEKQRKIVEICKKHGIILFFDEVYRFLEYEEEKR
jgi:aspartate/methionine/tyrosine aminotransferase